jgi:hypothetical protein
VNSTIKDFVDVGDPGAPIGSPAWCRAAHVQLCATKRQADSKVRHLKYDLLEFKKEERWKQLAGKGGKPFHSWKQYVETPEPDGLGVPLESVQAILEIAKDDALVGEVLGKHGQYGKGRPKPDRVDNVNSKGGNQKDYLLARLARDAPEILAAYNRGEYRSVRAAAIAAGIIEPPTPLDRLRTAWKKASTEEQQTFLKEINP